MFEALQAESLLQGLHWHGRSSLTTVDGGGLSGNFAYSKSSEGIYVAVQRKF
jgi:hypothetical protein